MNREGRRIIDPVTKKERKYTAEDVKKWMSGNDDDNDVHMTWHETPDGRLQKVPTVIHALHSGGISDEKGKVNSRLGDYKPIDKIFYKYGKTL